MLQMIWTVICAALLKINVTLTYVYLITYSKVFRYFIGLNDLPNVFIFSENILSNNCVSSCLQQLLKVNSVELSQVVKNY